ncbi:MAG: hypothetical protein GOMPHAMPRED_003420 [Gomphillus americanus]|uniref:RRM domain-containing protein n=1 Tax=Gomphillus americanus TaxID=1940652 RepID=A0A8H3FHP6_9LECA|nr:MAG: hypothetical protein GOMPHAMPRED_003420 [Gomphillus americanus]
MADNNGPSQQDSVSSTRLYLGNLPRDVTKEDIQEHFKSHGAGNITEVKLMNGFGFIEYDDAMDARDVVPAFHGTDLKGQRLTVQFARGPRPREPYGAPERVHPRPRRTQFRMELTGLADGTSWQDLKDFARQSGLDVVYSEVGRGNDGRGFVEFETSADLRTAVEKLDNTEFKGQAVHCVANELAEVPQYNRGRSRSPPRRGGGGGYGQPRDDYYGRRPPPHGYDDRRGDYRRRSPPPRDEYYGRGRYDSPPRGARGPPPEEYPPPPRGGYRDDPYGAPPRRYDDPYAGGYDRPPRRQSPPPRSYGGGGAGGYDERPPRGAY